MCKIRKDEIKGGTKFYISYFLQFNIKDSSKNSNIDQMSKTMLKL